jgi:hypothetical protein
MIHEWVRFELPVKPGSVRWARNLVTGFRDYLDQTTYADLRLMVSELVADAVRAGAHGRNEIACASRSTTMISRLSWATAARPTSFGLANPRPASWAGDPLRSPLGRSGGSALRTRRELGVAAGTAIRRLAIGIHSAPKRDRPPRGGGKSRDGRSETAK